MFRNGYRPTYIKEINGIPYSEMLCVIQKYDQKINNDFPQLIIHKP